jgi:hypothetical protein
MRAPPTIILPLAEAYLCECGLIINSANRCACGNEHGLLSLSAALNQDRGPTYEQVQSLIDQLDEVLTKEERIA